MERLNSNWKSVNTKWNLTFMEWVISKQVTGPWKLPSNLALAEAIGCSSNIMLRLLKTPQWIWTQSSCLSRAFTPADPGSGSWYWKAFCMLPKEKWSTACLWDVLEQEWHKSVGGTINMWLDLRPTPCNRNHLRHCSGVQESETRQHGNLGKTNSPVKQPLWAPVCQPYCV